MKKDWIARELTMEVVVGAFMVMVFLGLGYFTIILSRETWFGTKYPLEVVFRDVMGLREGDSVVVRGMPIGKVRNLHLAEDGVHVVTTLDQQIRLREGYRITIVSTSILGGRYLNVDEGPDTAPPVRAPGPYRGQAPYDLMADAAELINAAKKELIEGGVLDNFRRVSEELKAVAERLSKGEGTLGKLLSSDDSLYRDFAATVTSAREVSARLAKGEGSMGRLLSSDETLYNDLAESVAALKDVAQRLRKGEGTIGRLLASDDRLYDDLAATVAALKSVSEKLEKGEGTLGKLVNDDGMYNEIQGAVKDVRATLDDYRESSPVVTFSSIFFGAF